MRSLDQPMAISASSSSLMPRRAAARGRVREFGAADRGVLLGFADLISQLRDSDGHHPQALGQRRRQPFQLIEQGDAAE